MMEDEKMLDLIHLQHTVDYMNTCARDCKFSDVFLEEPIMIIIKICRRAKDYRDET